MGLIQSYSPELANRLALSCALCVFVQVLQKEGAREVYACATHAVFSPPAVERLSSGVFQEVGGQQGGLAKMLGKAVQR